MSSSNIISGFKATGLIPLDLSKVISKLRIKTSLKIPTPPSLSGSNKSFILGKIPGNLRQLYQLKQQLQELQDIVQYQAFSSSIAETILEKVIKSTEIQIQKNILLQDELHQCQAANKRQKKKKDVPQQFIQDGGSLTVEEAL